MKDKTPNQIVSYFHCSKCLDELPEGLSPKEWARTQTGFTKSGAIQVWCNRHDMNVAILDAIEESEDDVDGKETPRKEH